MRKQSFKIISLLVIGLLVLGPAFAADIKPALNAAPTTTPNWIDDSMIQQDSLNMIVGNSRVMRFKQPFTRVSISDPTVADVALISDKEIIINAQRMGSANLMVWDYSDQILVYKLTITPDPTPLEQALHSVRPMHPGEMPLQVIPTKQGFVVEGQVGTVEEQKKIADTAKAFATDSVSVVTVEKAKQILLAVRFIEVDRTNGFDFGIDGHYIAEKVGFTFLGGATGATLASDGVTTGLAKVATSNFSFPVLDSSKSSTLATAGYQDGNNRLQTFIKALEQKTKLRIIARPNLLVRDGEEASFLVGGEFPVPIVTNNNIEVTYKPFGTRLTYKPEVLDNKMLRLKIDTEVSQIDSANAVTLNNFKIPAVTSRKTTTVTELQNGSTLLISGLIQQRHSDGESGTPLLRKIPLLGRLFESTSNSKSEVELIVIITPRIIDPEKEAVDLKKLNVMDMPLDRALKTERPSFKDERADVIKNTLEKFEHEYQEVKATPPLPLPKQELPAALKNTKASTAPAAKVETKKEDKKRA